MSVATLRIERFTYLGGSTLVDLVVSVEDDNASRNNDESYANVVERYIGVAKPIQRTVLVKGND